MLLDFEILSDREPKNRRVYYHTKEKFENRDEHKSLAEQLCFRPTNRGNTHFWTLNLPKFSRSKNRRVYYYTKEKFENRDERNSLAGQACCRPTNRQNISFWIPQPEGNPKKES